MGTLPPYGFAPYFPQALAVQRADFPIGASIFVIDASTAPKYLNGS